MHLQENNFARYFKKYCIITSRKLLSDFSYTPKNTKNDFFQQGTNTYMGQMIL